MKKSKKSKKSVASKKSVKSKGSRKAKTPKGNTKGFKRYKSISRIDQPEKNNHGWYVRVHFKGKQISKFFSDQKNGGKRAALDKGVAFRDLTEQKMRKPRSERPVVVRTRKKGVVGVRETVYRTYTVEGELREAPVYEVTWSPKPGVVGRTSVSIRKWGKREAYRRAKELRQSKEREFYGWD